MGLFSKFRKKKENQEEMAMCECGNMCKVSDIEANKAKEEAKNKSCCDTDAKSSCCGNVDGDEIVKAQSAHGEGAAVKVLGSGCKKCNDLELATKTALENLGMDATIDHVTDFAQISSYGVMSTPALVIDGKVVSYGKVLKTEEVMAILQKERV